MRRPRAESLPATPGGARGKDLGAGVRRLVGHAAPAEGRDPGGGGLGGEEVCDGGGEGVGLVERDLVAGVGDFYE